MTRIAINGFGRIGRLVLRNAIERTDLQVIAINDVVSSDILAYLFKYDSVHGAFPGKVEHTDNSIIVNGKEIKVISERDPAKLPWKELSIDYVVESTGLFITAELAGNIWKQGLKGYLFLLLQKAISQLMSWVLTIKNIILSRTTLFQMLLVQRTVSHL